MTYEELRRLAKQTNWEKSRILFILLKKTMELLNEDDFHNGYVRHLFNDDNNELELYIISSKNQLLIVKYLYETQSTNITVYSLSDIVQIDLAESADGEKRLTITLQNETTICLNNRENYDNEHKDFLGNFTRDLIEQF